MDTLEFVVRLVLDGEHGTVQRNARSCMGSLTGTLPFEQQRDFWARHLDSDDHWVRLEAVHAVGSAIDLLKKDPKHRAIGEELAVRLRQIATADPHPRIRLQAKRNVTTYDDNSPPARLIDYGKKSER